MKSLLFTLLASLCFLLPSRAAFDVFIRFAQDGSSWLPGDSLHTSYLAKDGWSELRSFEFGMESVINIGSSTGGGGAGKANFKEIRLTKNSNIMSPRLFAACATGQHYDSVEIVAVRSGSVSKSPPRVFLLEMKLILVQDLTMSGSDGDDVVEESVILKHGAQRITFFGQSFDGTETTLGQATWSIVTNSATLDTGL